MKAGVIGATGYAGVELVRLLVQHPGINIGALSSVSFEGKKLSDIYPSMLQVEDMVLTNEQDAIDACDVVFACLPHGLSQEAAAKCATAGKLFIDIGADFRLHSEDEYKEWYGGEFLDKELHANAVYALPELFRSQIKGAKVLANPGCYPTSAALGLAPLVKAGMVKPDRILIDAKSGVTGAGRGLSQNTHFPDCNEALSLYKAGEHRHTPEIEQTLSILAKEKVTVTFVPHLVPLNRGILSTIYADLVENIPLEEIHSIYEQFYEGEKFVRILPIGCSVNLKTVRYSNYCDISVHLDKRTGRAIIASAIDNMVKGASGQAIQNMNIACGFDEDAGLNMVPPAF